MAKIAFTESVPTLQSIEMDDDRFRIEIDFTNRSINIVMQFIYSYSNGTKEIKPKHLHLREEEFDAHIDQIFPKVGVVDVKKTFKSAITSLLKNKAAKLL